MKKMGISDVPVVLRLDIPYALGVLGTFDSKTLVVHLYMGSIIQWLKYYRNKPTTDEEFKQLVLNSAINILIHELSHACQKYRYLNKAKVFTPYSPSQIERQTYENSYNIYKTLEKDLVEKFGVNPLESPFGYRYILPKRKYELATPEDMLIELFSTYDRMVNVNAYYDLQYRYVDVCSVTTDINCNIIDMEYLGFIRYNGVTLQDAIAKLQSLILRKQVKIKSVDYRYMSDLIDEDYCRIILFDSVSQYCPFIDEGVKRSRNKIRTIANKEIEFNYDLTHGYEKLVGDVDTFIESKKEEGK